MKKLSSMILVGMFLLPVTLFALTSRPNYELIACYNSVNASFIQQGGVHPVNGGDCLTWQTYTYDGYAKCDALYNQPVKTRQNQCIAR